MHAKLELLNSAIFSGCINSRLKVYKTIHFNITHTAHWLKRLKVKRSAYSFSSKFRKPVNENSSNYTSSNHVNYNKEWKIKEKRSHSVHGE